MIHDRALLKIAADGRIGQQGKDVVSFAEPVRYGEVTFAIVKLMMVLVMRGCPGKCGESVKKGNPVIRDVIQK